MLGAVTPPVGLCIYLASSIGGTPIEKSALAMKWFFLSAVLILMAVTYIPQLALFVPNFFGYN